MTEDKFFCDHVMIFLPDGRSLQRRLPLGGATDVDLRVTPARVLRSTANSAVATLPDLCKRMAPWVKLEIFPRIIRVKGGQEIAGYYSRSRKSVCVSLRQGRGELIGTLAHEIWHALETHISPEFLGTMEREMDTGLVPYGDGPEDKSYWLDPEERRARAFDAFAMRWVVGLPPYQTMSPVDSIFAAAWSGDLGQAIVDMDVGSKVHQPPKSALLAARNWAGRQAEQFTKLLTRDRATCTR